MYVYMASLPVGSSSMVFQTWLLVARDSLPASFLLLHMVSDSRDVSSVDILPPRRTFCLLRGLSSSSEDLRVASSCLEDLLSLLLLTLFPTGGDLMNSP